MSLITVIVILSLALIAVTAFAVYQIRLERRRSDARVAALASAIDDPRWQLPFQEEWPQELAAQSAPAVSLVVPTVERPSRAPAFAIAAVVIVGAGALLFAGMNGGSRPARQVATVKAPSIELVSMRHALDRETLIVSGLVRNPTASATPALSAVVSVLDRNGGVIARGASQLDAVVLGPGKETSFRVSVLEVADPGRYRLAFMNGSQIVPHVDRRSDLSRTVVNGARGN
jgi:hypothetical protein